MKITIDTSQDSKEDIRKIVALLSNYLNSSENSVISESSNGIFPEPVSEAGFFGAETNNASLVTSNSINSSSQSSILNSNNNLSNDALSGSNVIAQQTQEQPMPFMNIFGDDNSGNTGAVNSNPGNDNTINNTSGNNANVASQPTSTPDIFSVFGNGNTSSQNGVGSNNLQSSNIGANYTGGNLNNNEVAKPKKTFAGIFKGIPILGNLNFGQDEQHDELTEEEKEAAKKVVEY